MVLKKGVHSLITLLILILLTTIGCNSSKGISTSKAQSQPQSPMQVRVLLDGTKSGTYIEKQYKAYEPSAVRPISKSENWYIASFQKPGAHDNFLEVLESDPLILKVEMDDKSSGVKASKSQNKVKARPTIK